MASLSPVCCTIQPVSPPSLPSSAFIPSPAILRLLTVSGRACSWRGYIDLELSTCYNETNHWNALTDGAMKFLFSFFPNLESSLFVASMLILYQVHLSGILSPRAALQLDWRSHGTHRCFPRPSIQGWALNFLLVHPYFLRLHSLPSSSLSPPPS
jgi:hypothetical protein